MTASLLDTVVLARDILEHGLRRGDVGAVVEIYGADAVEVEFVTGAGRTQALLTLSAADIRPVADTEILAARTLTAA
jgi:hypothetical protein